ncbi:phosphate ABC transporter [Leptospira perolatii]|uniref:Phosphate ABC transporter n=1 Tax=Leptospira perolatii TaxID=2023191 RepID=A0A2M9ZPK2_9LEPT|nr:phosphate ABC transporter substrate-binding protein [Leptospira perolatii]PJZ70802.1 phosphate ABC transporter [Leptospira perolatii]PJZ74010.1 phosphate ABC transporter [Leptospira perolatii]
MNKCLIYGLIASVLLTANCKKDTLTITGSETMHTMLEVVSQGYNKEHSSLEIQVIGGGSFEGVSKLVEGKTDIAASSRALTSEETRELEKKGRFENVLLAYDGIALIVHPQNKIAKISLVDASKVFSGAITDWSQIGGTPGPIQVVIRNDKSGTAAYFDTHVLKQKDIGEKEFKANKNVQFTFAAQIVSNNDEMANAIQKNPNAIGFMGMGSAQIENKSKVKALAYSKTGKDPFIEPSINNVYNRSYKLSRGLYLFYLSDRGKKIDEFISFATGEEGQVLVLKSGYLRATLPTVEVQAPK